MEGAVATSLGLVGLPNSGKTTVFNAITGLAAPALSYPFCTIEPNVAVVPVPDPRLDALAKLLEPEEVCPATVQVVDIAGLVEGAHRGEGLGNRFLDEIRGVDAVLHVVRCFRNPTVARAGGSRDPIWDLQLVDTELMLADLEILTRRIEQVSKRARSGDSTASKELEALQWLAARLRQGVMPRVEELGSQERAVLERERFLVTKPCLVVANVDEDGLDPTQEPLRSLVEKAFPRTVFPFPAAVEADLARMEPEDREAFVRELGLGERRTAELVATGFRLLGLITFYTVARQKLHAWRMPRGSTALEAAGRIHSHMALGFVRADVCRVEDLMKHGSMAAVRHAGALRSEGKSYVVQDGDVLYIHFVTPV